MTDLPRDKRSITFEVVGDQEFPDLKRSKSSSVDKWSLDEEFPILFSENNPLNRPRPLGLNLKKSLILEELVEATLAQTKKDIKTRAERTSRPIDIKASNFPAVLLKIGKWEYVPKHEGDLVAKCYFAKQKLVWETLDGGLKSKIEMQWSDIVGLHANCPDHGPATLTIVLGRQPLFFKETNPQPRKHTLWKATCDFTNGEATKYMEHCIKCAPGILKKHYEKLIKYIPCHLSQPQGTELNFQLATKGSNKIRQVNTPSLSRNVSISSLLNHIGHRISEKKPSPVSPFSENVSVGVNQDNMLENINSDILPSEPTRASDDESLMSRINSLCNLLQDDEIEYSTLESLWNCSPIPMHELGSSDQAGAIN
uniref:uncharacterized protein LOC122595626 isoform X2 n=1 Tax=Erigeron canadensis TaxID=72917 RepID=UPI001CB9AA08|nr:uncharacterized protein LOC122595626 isoform X2 [Erigeron canadensis]